MRKVNKLTKQNSPLLNEIIKTLNLKKITNIKEKRYVSGGYVSDLLSDVIANADESFVWITIQKHINILAVAKLKKISAIIIANGFLPDDAVIKKAEEEGVILLTTNDNSFEISGKLYCYLKNYMKED